MDRKKFLTSACAACGAAVVISTFNSCLKESNTLNLTLNLSNPANSALLTTGGNVTMDDVIIINRGNNTYVAFSLICTDTGGCIVAYTGTGFKCPCHNGVFNNNGAVVSGPPPAPLTQYTVTRAGEMLTVSS